MSIFSSDITAEKKLEESLCRERLIKELHIEAMSHLAGGLAHEISNPLAIIMQEQVTFKISPRRNRFLPQRRLRRHVEVLCERRNGQSAFCVA
jgi:hypothetical protein